MSLLAIGLNHKTAPIDLREKFAFSKHTLQSVLKKLFSETKQGEIALLSTCNRTEVYCPHQNADVVIDWLGNYGNLTKEQATKSFYQHYDQKAVKHVMRVASGLDSMILGENQILAQMKTAFGAAKEAGTLGKNLHRLFQTTFAVAKQVRSNTAIGASALSIAYAAVKLSSRVFTDVKEATVLFVGAGDTIELSAFHLDQLGVSNMYFANRTLEKSEQLSSKHDGKVITLENISDVIADVDIVFTATSSPLPILGKGMIERAIKQRKHKPMFMVDLGVPRDIEPEVSTLDDVYLYTVDDLQHIVDDNLQMRMQAAELAESMIDEKSEQFMHWMRAQQNIQTIISYRQEAQHFKDSELIKAKKALANGHSPDIVLEKFAHDLTKKLIHQPTVAMRDTTGLDEQALVALAKAMLGLDNQH